MHELVGQQSVIRFVKGRISTLIYMFFFLKIQGHLSPNPHLDLPLFLLILRSRSRIPAISHLNF